MNNSWSRFLPVCVAPARVNMPRGIPPAGWETVPLWNTAPYGLGCGKRPTGRRGAYDWQTMHSTPAAMNARTASASLSRSPDAYLPCHGMPFRRMHNAQRTHVATCAAHGMLRVARATAPRSERAHAACYTAVHARLGQGGAFMWTVAWFGASKSGMQHAARHVAYNTEEGHTLGTPSRRAAAAFSAAHRNGSRLRESESSDGSRRSAHAPFAQTAVALPRLSCVQCV